MKCDTCNQTFGFNLCNFNGTFHFDFDYDQCLNVMKKFRISWLQVIFDKKSSQVLGFQSNFGPKMYFLVMKLIEIPSILMNFPAICSQNGVTQFSGFRISQKCQYDAIFDGIYLVKSWSFEK